MGVPGGRYQGRGRGQVTIKLVRRVRAIGLYSAQSNDTCGLDVDAASGNPNVAGLGPHQSGRRSSFVIRHSSLVVVVIVEVKYECSNSDRDRVSNPGW